MACLPEDQLEQSSSVSGNFLNKQRSPQETPSPPPAPRLGGVPPSPNPVVTTTTTAIYARVNPNLKRDKTNNNNFSSSTFAPIHSMTTDQKLQGKFFILHLYVATDLGSLNETLTMWKCKNFGNF